MWLLSAALAGLWQASDGVSLNTATVGVVGGLMLSVTGALTFVFRQLLAAKDQQIKECSARAEKAEARADDERKRGDALAAAERLRTDEALATLRDLQQTSREAVGHAERALETARSNNRGGGRT